MRKGVGALLAALAITGCTDRERVVFPPDNDHTGPIVFIDQPQAGDTTVHAGPGAAIAGQLIDPDGVDSLYIELVGGNEHFSPLATNQDSVRFGFSVTTNGLAGRSILVLVFGTDRLGNRGDTAIVRIGIVP